MVYDLSKELDRERFKARGNALFKKGAVVELTERCTRTTRQNSYLHLLLGIVALETGNTIEDAKDYYFKRLINPDIFVVNKVDELGNKIDTLLSSAIISKERMCVAIDRLKMWGAENGIYLPDAEDTESLREAEVEIEKSKRYL